MKEHPDPLVPPDVDLRDFGFMPLEVARLRDSDLASLPDAEAFRCNVLSWCVAWHQLPAASLPDDDAALARLLGFGRDIKAWVKARRSGAMRGWVLCSDGRLYHPVVAEKAIEAWTQKQAQRSRTTLARIAAMEKRIAACESDHEREHLQTVLHGLQQSLSQAKKKPVTNHVAETKGELRDRDSKGTGTVKGQGHTEQPAVTDPAGAANQPAGEPTIPTDAGIAILAMRRAGLGVVNPGDPRLLDLIAAGVTPDEFAAAARTAIDRGKGFAYALGTIDGRRRDAKKLVASIAGTSAPPGRDAVIAEARRIALGDIHDA